MYFVAISDWARLGHRRRRRCLSQRWRIIWCLSYAFQMVHSLFRTLSRPMESLPREFQLSIVAGWYREVKAGLTIDWLVETGSCICMCQVHIYCQVTVVWNVVENHRSYSIGSFSRYLRSTYTAETCTRLFRRSFAFPKSTPTFWSLMHIYILRRIPRMINFAFTPCRHLKRCMEK